MAFGLSTEISEKTTVDTEISKEGKVVEEKKEIVKEVVVADNPDNPDPAKEPTEEIEENIKPDGTEITDESVLAYFNSKRDKDNQLKSLDEIYKVKEVEKIVEKEVNPYTDVMSESDKAYFKFKRDTGLGREEWDFVNQDVKSIPLLELAKKKVFDDTTLDLNEKDLKEYLQETLSIDFDELSISDKVKLNGFVKSTRANIIETQNKYKNTEKAKPVKTDDVEMVELDNGKKMPKSDYDKLVKDRNDYVKNIEEGVNSVTSSDFKLIVTENGEKREIDLGYEYSKEDKHSMLSDALDINNTISERYRTKDGFKYKELSMDLFRGKKENFEKILQSISQQVRAKTIEEMTASSNNETFGRKTITPVVKTEKGYGNLGTGFGKKGGFGL